MSDPNPLTVKTATGRVLVAYRGNRKHRTQDVTPSPEPQKMVRFAPVRTVLPPPPPSRRPLPGHNRARSNDIISGTLPKLEPAVFKGANGRKLEVARLPGGGVRLSAPPPPLGEITFSGGGGKGSALPGAVAALDHSGVLKGVKRVSGASVGSMTAALVATGCSAEEFAVIANAPGLGPVVKDGKKLPLGLEGEGLENLVRDSMATLLITQIKTAGVQDHPEVKPIYEKLSGGKKGPTFGDMRVLARHIEGVKEVSINATGMGYKPENGKGFDELRVPEVVCFSADNEPDLEIARVVHASAALPPVFKPVDIELKDRNITMRFQDGGVLNNAPTSSSLGLQRDVDPIPEQGALTFVFQEEASEQIREGRATPGRSRVNDFIAKAENSAADYAKNRALADRPEDVVMVPLKYRVIENGKTKKKDFRGLLSGTANFDISIEDKLDLQRLTDAETSNHLTKREQPKSQQFLSTEQMLMCLPRKDVEALAADGFEGADRALAFRDQVVETVATLRSLVGGDSAETLAKSDVVLSTLGELERLADGDPDRQDFVAREINRTDRLDGLLAALRKGDSSGSGMLAASYALNDMLLARERAKTVLAKVIYPKMVRQGSKGPGAELLIQVDNRLRKVSSVEDYNGALKLAIDHFKKKRDLLNWNDHKQFAVELEGHLIKVA